ncbi:MAG: hypothetical protein A4S09_06135 [Proteobacteria bacterium SG_bin7]|nr:MAG: hypothetical protein A4S09_06135 [Proteobacteria bacterium SG_bin7]
MKRIVLVLSLLVAQATANAKGFGAGFVLGSPSALSAKYWTQSSRAFDFGLGWDSNDMFFFSDYLFHFPGGFDSLKLPARLVPYVGIGALIKIYNDSARKANDNSNNSLRLVARVPLGFEWMVQKFPLGIFLEIVPGLRVSPNTSSEFGAGIGIRFYF